MRLFRKCVAFLLYGALFLPGGESFRLTTWMRAVAVTSTAFDSTMRRRRSQMESDRLARSVQMLQMDAEHEERTLRLRWR
jgi:hypothetical protein